MDEIQRFRSQFKIKENQLLLFPYGSTVYGTSSPKSDQDYNAIILNNSCTTGEEYFHNNINIHIYNADDWQNQLIDHKIHALEAYFLPDGICKDHFCFDLNLKTLRESLMEKASHSFVKAKKKIIIEKDYYIAWKSLFHSLRILKFGIQIAKFNKITDFGEANQFWTEIVESQRYTWDYFENKYKPIYNELATEFRKVAPK